MRSGTSDTRVAMHGTPVAIASTIAFGSPSVSEVSTRKSIEARKPGVSVHEAQQTHVTPKPRVSVDPGSCSPGMSTPSPANATSAGRSC
jgi:hypothetical protein